MAKRKRNEKKRRCRCQPNCYKILSRKQRARHRKRVSANDIRLILPSETVSEASDTDSMSSDIPGSLNAINNQEPLYGAQRTDTPPIVASDTSSHSELRRSQSLSQEDVGNQLDGGGWGGDWRGQSLEVGDDREPGGDGNSGQNQLMLEDVEYDEEEEIEGVLTLEERRQQLEDDMGDELERELYDARQ